MSLKSCRQLRGVKALTIGLLATSVLVTAWAVFVRDSVMPPTLAEVPGQTGFHLRPLTIDSSQIRAGGPPKDGIPALTDPEFVKAAQATYLRLQDRVIGVTLQGESRAYPLAILNYHEIVNDTLGQTPLVVTYCPLCDSAAVFDRRTPLGPREFGVSGLLYNSNVLMYDRGGQPESLWSQVQSTGISGPGARQRLTTLPCELTTWESWKARFPKTLAMSLHTGHQRDYRRNPYAAYFTNQQLMFPAAPASQQVSSKERILGVWVGDQYRAYHESSFPAGQDEYEDTLGDKQLTVALDRKTHELRVTQADEGVSWLYSFWFAWYAMHPGTTVYNVE